jgi:hypothetical protein
MSILFPSDDVEGNNDGRQRAALLKGGIRTGVETWCY